MRKSEKIMQSSDIGSDIGSDLADEDLQTDFNVDIGEYDFENIDDDKHKDKRKHNSSKIGCK